MKISGFTMVKNATKLYFPIKQSILSILPMVDEFVVALGDCDDDDNTLQEIESIQSDKIKIIHAVWDLNKYSRGTENAHQTDIAKEACTGDWLFYLQADEVVHEKYLSVVKKACETYLKDKEIEGLLFNYKHFWGDYEHYHYAHNWYPKEIRVIRNDKDIHSWESAQSFRKIPDFDGVDYRQQKNTFKLKVVNIDAYIFHYGWVRPPFLMTKKKKALDTIHKGKEVVEKNYENVPDEFSYGSLGKLAVYKDTHPKVMQEWILKHDWSDKLNYSKTTILGDQVHKHNKLKTRLTTFLEQKLLGGKQIGGFKNYILLKKSRKLKEIDYSPEEYVIKGKVIYFYSPNGYGKAKMSNNFFEQKLKVAATTRNLNTTKKLLEMAK